MTEQNEVSFEDVVRRCTEIQLNGIVAGERLSSTVSTIVQLASTWAYMNGVKDTESRRNEKISD